MMQFLDENSALLEQKKDIRRGNMRSGWTERFDTAMHLLCYQAPPSLLDTQWSFPCRSGTDAPPLRHINRPPQPFPHNPAPPQHRTAYDGASGSNALASMGWRTYRCNAQGADHYFHSGTGISQWELPSLTQVPPAAELYHPPQRCFHPDCRAKPFWAVDGFCSEPPFQVLSCVIHLGILAADASRTKMEVVQVSDSESEDSSVD